jgi:lysophospholipase L1-like esterase
MPWVLAAHPKRLTIQCGVNDINQGWVWSDELTNLIAIKAKCDSTNIMLVLEEIFPWSNGNDAQALTIRTWNTNLANYAASNGVTLVKIHDALGQLRVSTGFLDNIKTSYNQDGVHLNASGEDAWSLLLLTNLVGAVSGNNSTLNTGNMRSAP